MVGSVNVMGAGGEDRFSVLPSTNKTTKEIFHEKSLDELSGGRVFGALQSYAHFDAYIAHLTASL